jgi:hypothetical protein
MDIRSGLRWHTVDDFPAVKATSTAVEHALKPSDPESKLLK